MPWKLENSSGSNIKYFLPNKMYTIGRALADFIVNDKSISRKHANIIWENNLNYLKVDDFSKFGTSINKVPMKNKNGLLKNGDTITFGAQPGVDFKCSFVSFNVVISNLYHDDKILLKQILPIGGGNLVDNWNENVDYLVMSNLKVTFKVVCALIKQVSIVKIDFIKEMIAYFKGEISILPNPQNYTPEIGLSDEIFPNAMFQSNLKRQSLFNNKTFYFMSQEKFSRLSEAIICGGGHAFLLTEESFNSDMKIKLVQPDSIVMNETIITNLVKMVLFILKTAGKRAINDSEIGFAVLHVSIDDYCNPSKPFNRLEKLENDVSRISSPNPPVKIIKQTNLNNPSVPVKRKITESRNSPDYSSKNLKRKKTEILKTDEENENYVDLDRISSPKNQINNKSNSLKPKPKNCLKKDNEDISSILLQFKKGSPEKNNRLFSEIKNNQEDSNDEFDKISVPGFVDPLKFSNKKTISEKPKSINASSLKKSENLSNILQNSKNSDYLDGDKSKNESVISRSNERITILNEQFDNQTIVTIPTELRNIQSEVSENVACVDGIVKFIKLVKENYVECENFKTFQKKSNIYIEQNPVKVVVCRK